MARVIIGCRLPNGIVLEHPANPLKKVELSGMNKVTIIGAGFAQNDVDADFWEAWISANGKFPAVKNGSIFVAKSSDDAMAKARDMKKEKTGFEPMAQDAGGVTKAA